MTEQNCCPTPYVIRSLVTEDTETTPSYELREDGGFELREDGGFELR